MTQEHKLILEMLKDGQISVEEAERLMDALPKEAPQTPAVSGGLAPKRLHILVTENGKGKVNIKIPFSLVRAGLKVGQTFAGIGSRYTGDSEAAMAMELLKDIDVDEILASINDGELTLPYTMADVEDEEKGDHVQVVLE